MAENPDRKSGPTFVFRRDDQKNTRKRRREEDTDDAEGFPEPEPEFYGFPADSFIYGENPIEIPIPDIEASSGPPVVRRTSRNSKKKRKQDFVYY